MVFKVFAKTYLIISLNYLSYFLFPPFLSSQKGFNLKKSSLLQGDADKDSKWSCVRDREFWIIGITSISSSLTLILNT